MQQGSNAVFALFTVGNWEDWTSSAYSTILLKTQVCTLPAAAVNTDCCAQPLCTHGLSFRFPQRWFVEGTFSVNTTIQLTDQYTVVAFRCEPDAAAAVSVRNSLRWPAFGFVNPCVMIRVG